MDFQGGFAQFTHERSEWEREEKGHDGEREREWGMAWVTLASFHSVIYEDWLLPASIGQPKSVNYAKTVFVLLSLIPFLSHSPVYSKAKGDIMGRAQVSGEACVGKYVYTHTLCIMPSRWVMHALRWMSLFFVARHKICLVFWAVEETIVVDRSVTIIQGGEDRFREFAYILARTLFAPSIKCVMV